MDTNNIISQVAQLIRTRDVSQKDQKEIKVQKDLNPPKDEVELSSAGETFATAAMPDYEKEQAMKVERLKALVQSGNYKMDDEMVNNIAERIAKSLLA